MARNLGGRSIFVSDDSKLNDPWAFERAAAVCTGWSGACQGAGAILSNNPNRRTPYIIQWLFDIQRQIDNDTALELAYMGGGGHKLERWRIWNEALSRTGPNDFGPIEARRPWPAYGIIYAPVRCF